MAFLTFLKFFRQNVKKFSQMESPLKNINFPEGYEDLAHEKHVLVAGWFRKVTNKRHRNVLRYLLVTKLDIFLFRETLFRKKLELSVTFSWLDVKEIIYGKDQSTTFVFGQGQRLQIATTGPRYFQHFYKFLTSVLVPEEYPVFTYPQSVALKRGHGSVVERLKLVMKRGGHTLSQAAESSIVHYLNKNPSEFRLNQLKMIINYLPTFLASLAWIRSVKTLIVPCKATLGAHNPMKLLADYLPKNETIQKIVFRDRLRDGFPLLVSLLVNMKIRPIDSLWFEGCDLSFEEIDALMRWIQCKGLYELVLKNSLSPMVTNAFLTGLKANPGTRHIRILVLDGSLALNVTTLLSFVANVEVLSLERCDIEIAEFFNAIGQMPACQIQKVLISGNKCTRMIERNMKLPPSLWAIAANDIFWHPVCLRHFFVGVIRHMPIKPHVRCQLSNARLPPGKWDEFFARMSRMKSVTLESLKWDGNPVSEYFFDFLENCPSLISLSLNGTFGLDDPLIRTCAEFLSDSHTIVNFMCCGTPRKSMGTKGTNLMIESLRRNRSIKTFDISGNNAGPRMLIALAHILLKNRYVESVNIENNDITELESFHTFFEKMRQRGRPLEIKWPEGEIQKMLQYGTATESMVKETKALHERVQCGDATIKIEKEMVEAVEGEDVAVPVVQETAIVMPAAEDVL